MSTLLARLGALTAVALVLAGCGSIPEPDATHLRIVTTNSGVDTAAAQAISKYISAQGVSTEIVVQDDAAAVYERLEADDTHGDADIGVVVASVETTDQVATVEVAETVEIVAQAPVALHWTVAASQVTQAGFVLPTIDDNTTVADPACTGHTWYYQGVGEQQLAAMTQSILAQGCQPTFAQHDGAPATQLAQELTEQPDTAALWYQVEPVITDFALGSLPVETSDWPQGAVVAVSATELDDTMVSHLGAVLEVLDEQSATSLLRHVAQSQTSSSDLVYDMEHAVTHWLSQHNLLEQDTVDSTFEVDQ